MTLNSVEYNENLIIDSTYNKKIQNIKREYKINIQTGEDFETGIIDGNLNSVIIDSSEYVSITIESSLGYLIFQNSQHKGISYYAPRALLQGTQSHIAVNDQFEKFKINEPINIRVAGPDSKVSIILRID